jgi:hypothetical protein
MNIANIEQPFVFALLKGISSPLSKVVFIITYVLYKLNTIQNIKPLFDPVKFYFDSKMSSSDTGVYRRIAYRIDEPGSISFWHIPKNLELLVSEFVRTRRPIGKSITKDFLYTIFNYQQFMNLQLGKTLPTHGRDFHQFRPVLPKMRQ